MSVWGARKHTCTAYSPSPPEMSLMASTTARWRARWTVGMVISQQRSPLEPSPLPKGVNQVVNQGARVVNSTWQSCESPFPPARELWIAAKSRGGRVAVPQAFLGTRVRFHGSQSEFELPSIHRTWQFPSYQLAQFWLHKQLWPCSMTRFRIQIDLSREFNPKSILAYISLSKMWRRVFQPKIYDKFMPCELSRDATRSFGRCTWAFV